MSFVTSRVRKPEGSYHSIFIIFLVLTVWMGWLSGLFGNKGLKQAYHLLVARNDLTLRVKTLENEKQRLTETLAALNTDPVFQEKTIRESLGYVRKGELVFETE